jgi:hypothetical protein
MQGDRSEMYCDSVDWIDLAQDGEEWLAVMNLRTI